MKAFTDAGTGVRKQAPVGGQDRWGEGRCWGGGAGEEDPGKAGSGIANKQRQTFGMLGA